MVDALKEWHRSGTSDFRRVGLCLAALVGVLLALAVGWQVGTGVAGNPDDGAAEWLRADGAAVMRWDNRTPLGLLQMDPSGTVQAVGYANHPRIGEGQIEVLCTLKECNRLAFRQCQFVDKPRLARLSTMPVLNMLLAENCNLTDADVPTLAGLTNVRYFYLSGNPMSDAGINSLRAQLPNSHVMWASPDKKQPGP